MPERDQSLKTPWHHIDQKKGPVNIAQGTYYTSFEHSDEETEERGDEKEYEER